MQLEKLHIVLLPGLDGSGRMFRPFLEKLPLDCKVTVIAYPGDRHIPFEDLPGFIIPQLPKDERLLLVGESYSGPVITALSQRPELQVTALVFVATFARFPATLLKIVARLLPLSLLFRFSAPAVFIRHFCFGKWISTQAINMVRESLASNKPEVIASRARSGASIDVISLLPGIDKPCLYIRASNDRMVPAKAMQDFVDNIPQCQQVEIEGPHCLMQARPAECLSAINFFIESLPG